MDGDESMNFLNVVCLFNNFNKLFFKDNYGFKAYYIGRLKLR